MEEKSNYNTLYSVLVPISEQFRKELEALNISIPEMARMLGTSTASIRSVVDWDKTKSTPTFKTMIKLANMLDMKLIIDLEEFHGPENEEKT